MTYDHITDGTAQPSVRVVEEGVSDVDPHVCAPPTTSTQSRGYPRAELDFQISLSPFLLSAIAILSD